MERTPSAREGIRFSHMQRVALNDNGALYWLLGDHLGSTSLTTDASGNVVARQLYDAWGNVRVRGDVKTDIGYTSQREEVGIHVMFYRARYFSPALGRFLSADSIIPGAADGSGGGAGTLGVDSGSRLTTLTTDFHEFIGQVTQENQAVLQYGPFFQWSEQVRQDNPVPSGPLNPQALNRYSYVLNNPLRYVDPTGHDTIEVKLSAKQIREYRAMFLELRSQAENLKLAFLGIGGPTDFIVALREAAKGNPVLGAAILGLYGGAVAEIEYHLSELDRITELLDKLVETAEASGGYATLIIESTDALGFSYAVRCKAPSKCSTIVTIVDYYPWSPGTRNVVGVAMWAGLGQILLSDWQNAMQTVFGVVGSH